MVGSNSQWEASLSCFELGIAQLQLVSNFEQFWSSNISIFPDIIGFSTICQLFEKFDGGPFLKGPILLMSGDKIYGKWFITNHINNLNWTWCTLIVLNIIASWWDIWIFGTSVVLKLVVTSRPAMTLLAAILSIPFLLAGAYNHWYLLCVWLYTPMKLPASRCVPGMRESRPWGSEPE